MKNLVFVLSVAFSLNALAAGDGNSNKYDTELLRLYGQATGKDPKVTNPEDRIEAAQKYYWMTKARSMCDFSTESTSDCLSALMYEDRFDPKKFCVAASSHQKNHCQREGALITKTMDALDHDVEATHGRAEALKDLAKKIVERAQKEQASGSPAAVPAPGNR